MLFRKRLELLSSTLSKTSFRGLTFWFKKWFKENSDPELQDHVKGLYQANYISLSHFAFETKLLTMTVERERAVRSRGRFSSQRQ